MPLWNRMTEIDKRSHSTQLRLARVKTFKMPQGVTLHENARRQEKYRITAENKTLAQNLLSITKN